MKELALAGALVAPGNNNQIPFFVEGFANRGFDAALEDGFPLFAKVDKPTHFQSTAHFDAVWSGEEQFVATVVDLDRPHRSLDKLLEPHLAADAAY